MQYKVMLHVLNILANYAVQMQTFDYPTSLD